MGIDIKLVWLLAAIIAIVVFFYVVLPKLKLEHKSGLIFRSVLFGAMMVYLGIDFIQREKYTYLVVLALGCVGFVMMVMNTKPKK